jgi:alpha-beta hydrolase superfamily lysophospholipase
MMIRLIFLLLAFACGQANARAGTIAVAHWPRASLASEAAGLAPPPAAGASALKLMFRYPAEHGRREAGSGLAILPEGPVRGILLFLPGSNFVRARAASQPEAENGITEAAVFAGQGLAVLIPDYPGLGESLRPQAFTLIDVNLAAIRALIAAARREPALAPLGQSGLPLFLMGFSQGGQLAVALHRSLERHPITGLDHRATVAVAPPLDLAGMLQRRLVTSDAMGRALLAGAVWAHGVAADQPVETLFTPPVAHRISWWMDGAHDATETMAALPETVPALLHPDFRAGIARDPGHWFNRSIARASRITTRFVPRRPLRLVTGDADPIVEPAAVQPLLDHARPRGGAVEWVRVADADHMGALRAAYGPALAWFSRLAAAPARTATP